MGERERRRTEKTATTKRAIHISMLNRQCKNHVKHFPRERNRKPTEREQKKRTHAQTYKQN